MPRSKRSKLVTLAQTDKKGRANKERIFDEVREGLDTYRYVWLMLLDNVRTPVLQEIRQAWTGSKLLMGKRKVLEKALGDTRENEYKENLYKFTKLCNGVTGLLFTNETPEVVEEYFKAYEKADFSRPNSKAPISFTIPEGIIYSRGGQVPVDDDIPMVHSLEPTLRTKYDIPTKIKAGKITLETPYVVCEEGETLDVRKALILKQFGIAASVFKVKLAGYYDNDSSELTTTKINID
ncbi:similar to Saccharomyces cerevisiae YKL009W MRT4 Protein involved in mRNA turnover and ribosome assembly, localizes to the nucleolus [Maudiozyma barnettii]|uniref:Ribosome assembly factor mrt4 n=1 Tax=Maudiozyma barnettii TaxID=61262 RepID=A0A8H2VJJ4_9SACH|nr:Mrt4p [Kazachstania barnettii]CAB4256864.1 similar to Saccharomyces cerevisiae YKL009W MRT4 Protein involved in mRNA turnover and ribosome assembly, localizes to the nucleolus [Kazachstania barnettii]CAD1785283.1 similar to Saccharomyces cerevisiae YKL009W MRT4 Protein involved in mRNA turnover and ribosome assembly, localizes to the nucleolus [Kazachstania barnettii]